MIYKILSFFFPPKSMPKLPFVEFIFRGEKARTLKELCDKDNSRAAHYDLWSKITEYLPNEDLSYGTQWTISNDDALTTRIYR